MESTRPTRSDQRRISATVALTEFRQQLQGWLQRHPGPGCVIHDFDADGISSAALWLRHYPEDRPLCAIRRDRWPEPTSARQCFLDLCPQQGQGALVIDHHPPPDQTQHLILSAYNWQPTPCTSLLLQQLLDSPWHWLAALGALSDLGEKAPFPLLQEQLAQWGKGRMQNLASLINSAHRAGGQPQLALQALLEHPDPLELSQSRHSAVEELRAYQDKVRQRLAEAKKTAPRFFGPLAVLEFASDCSVQGLLAQIWRTRLPKYLVLAANVRQDLDQVHLSGRCSRGRQLVEEAAARGLKLQGHPQSAGAVLSQQAWQQWKESQSAYPD
jgi:single-stranded-DNA-specific exonuclease